MNLVKDNNKTIVKIGEYTSIEQAALLHKQLKDNLDSLGEIYIDLENQHIEMPIIQILYALKNYLKSNNHKMIITNYNKEWHQKICEMGAAVHFKFID